MDTAVALVRSYLQANGFFTVTEYPILENGLVEIAVEDRVFGIPGQNFLILVVCMHLSRFIISCMKL